MIKIHKKYKLEKEMCDEIIYYAKQDGWVVYPEQGGWDLLLVRNKIQVGIQTKLRPTVKLLSQALVSTTLSGPHYRVVAVGNTNWLEKQDFAKIVMALRLIYIDMSVNVKFWIYKSLAVSIRYYRHFPNQLVWTPPFVPELDAGIPSPKTVSPWKIAAVRLELIAINKGWVSIIDSREVVQQEVPLDKVGSYPRTLLQTYFKSTEGRDPRNKKCKRWVLKRNAPSRKFINVFNALKGK